MPVGVAHFRGRAWRMTGLELAVQVGLVGLLRYASCLALLSESPVAQPTPRIELSPPVAADVVELAPSREMVIVLQDAIGRRVRFSFERRGKVLTHAGVGAMSAWTKTPFASSASHLPCESGNCAGIDRGSDGRSSWRTPPIELFRCLYPSIRGSRQPYGTVRVGWNMPRARGRTACCYWLPRWPCDPAPTPMGPRASAPTRCGRFALAWSAFSKCSDGTRTCRPRGIA